MICLPAGIWEENIKIEKSITLRGMGAEQMIIDGIEDGYPVVWIMGPEEAVQTISVRVEGLTITGAEGECADKAEGISATGLRPCFATGVLIQGRAQVAITDATIYENRWNGLVLLDTAQAEIIGSIISGNRVNGIELRGSAKAVITGSTISENRTGIWIMHSAKVEITGSTISDSGADGIHLWNEAVLRLVNSRILRNLGYGVSIYLPDGWAEFTGQVTGSGNLIPGPDEPDGNRKGAVCPPELAFLML
ncbi:right-handed parallel beta-helix repeat-containing protein [Candidatus Bipolaricaulota bacterium]|nr:right-handed parallel beta-helix repeat-containing protein [Candidatus Bipolaricaulota bacterium]